MSECIVSIFWFIKSNFFNRQCVGLFIQCEFWDFVYDLVVLHLDKMSAYDNVVSGKLKLKGKALDVKTGGIKKKKKQKKQYEDVSEIKQDANLDG